MDSSSDVKHYAWPSTVNFANFVTVKACLEGDERSNFKMWKEQMLCLLESQDVLGFVDGGILPPETGGDSDDEQKRQWRRTDRLVKGWILGSIRKDALDAVWEKPTARDVWLELDNIFQEEEEEEEENEKEKEKKKGEDYCKYLELCRAIERGHDWEFVQNFFQDTKELTTTVITKDLETALHVAVLSGTSNHFVKMLVELSTYDAVAAKDCNGETALHNAAEVGNTEAAMALVDKNASLMYILNSCNRLPVHEAAIKSHKETLNYLIHKCDPNATDNNPFQGQLGIKLLNAIIASQFVG